MTPKEKYQNDAEYHQLVDMLVSFISTAQFTPSELREASIFACIKYEMEQIHIYEIDPELNAALSTLDKFINTKTTDKDL